MIVRSSKSCFAIAIGDRGTDSSTMATTRRAWTELDVQEVLKSMLLADRPGEEPGSDQQLRGASGVQLDRRARGRGRRHRASRFRPAPRSPARSTSRSAVSTRSSAGSSPRPRPPVPSSTDLSDLSFRVQIRARRGCPGVVLSPVLRAVVACRQSGIGLAGVAEGRSRLPAYPYEIAVSDPRAGRRRVCPRGHPGTACVTPVRGNRGGHVRSGARLLAIGAFDLLIADVRLRGFNGLHLVRQFRRDRPEMATMIMTGYDDTMMELEAGRYGAAFVRKPINPAAFLDTVAKSLAETRRARRWQRKRDRRRLSRDGEWPSCGRSGCVLRGSAPRDTSFWRTAVALRRGHRRTRPAPRRGLGVVPTRRQRRRTALRRRARRPTRRPRPKPGATSSIGCRRNGSSLSAISYQSQSLPASSFPRLVPVTSA